MWEPEPPSQGSCTISWIDMHKSTHPIEIVYLIQLLILEDLVGFIQILISTSTLGVTSSSTLS